MVKSKGWQMEKETLLLGCCIGFSFGLAVGSILSNHKWGRGRSGVKNGMETVAKGLGIAFLRAVKRKRDKHAVHPTRGFLMWRKVTPPTMFSDAVQVIKRIVGIPVGNIQDIVSTMLTKGKNHDQQEAKSSQTETVQESQSQEGRRDNRRVS